MFDIRSRYADLPTSTHVDANGNERTYVTRRFLPAGDSLATLLEVAIGEGDRLDLIASRTLGDPELFWRICDANEAMRPDELTEEPGDVVRVPVPLA